MSSEHTLNCESTDHQMVSVIKRSDDVIEDTASLFSALGEVSRLRLLELLFDGPRCVSELAHETEQSMSLISQRLKILHQARLVNKERQGKHIYYSLSDEHIVQLLNNAFDHVEEHK